MGIFFKDLKDEPSEKKLSKIIKIDLIAIIVVYVIMSLLFYFSNTPMDNIFLGEVCFNGEFIKLHVFTSNDVFKPFNPTLYTIGQAIDYLFMVCYAAGLFALTLKNTRRLEKSGKLEKFGFLSAELVIVAAFMDAFENLFIFLMLTNITGFPNWYAIAQSVFAVIKWGLIFFDIGLNIIILLKRKIERK
ncbi:MAG: hypothetical protein ACTSRZ_07705 [Promethearchaeota archaeon]